MDDLGAWRYEGIIYQKSEDPRVAGGGHEYWAPDVIQGKDGRYYIYYCPDDSIRSIGVAVCDKPAGQYHFLGIVHDENENNIGEREGDTIQFDPGVFPDMNSLRQVLSERLEINIIWSTHPLVAMNCVMLSVTDRMGDGITVE